MEVHATLHFPSLRPIDSDADPIQEGACFKPTLPKQPLFVDGVHVGYVVGWPDTEIETITDGYGVWSHFVAYGTTEVEARLVLPTDS